MPATRWHMSDQSIESYIESNNPDILIHMNYITRVFSDNSIENRSIERESLQRYCKLANKLGTKNILIHLPYTINEMNNIEKGIKVLSDELKSMTVHLEIPAWSSDMLKNYKFSEYLSRITELLQATELDWYLVPDTAHLHSIGMDVPDMIEFIKKYDAKIKYIHLNGNSNPKYKMDKHVPIFSSENKIKDHSLLSKFIASTSKICIAEITKISATWDEWISYAETYDFNLVEFNETYSY